MHIASFTEIKCKMLRFKCYDYVQRIEQCSLNSTDRKEEKASLNLLFQVSIVIFDMCL